MKKDRSKTRAAFLFPYLGTPLIDRLRNSGAVDLKDNHTIDNLGNGYISIKAIDSTKKI